MMTIRPGSLRDTIDSGLLLDVLHLLAKFLYFFLQRNHSGRNAEIGGLGPDRVHFAIHFLQNEVEPSANCVSLFERVEKLVHMAAEPDALFGDISPFRKEGDFFFEADRIRFAAGPEPGSG